MKKILFITACVLVMAGGLWWQVWGMSDDAQASSPAVEPAGPVDAFDDQNTSSTDDATPSETIDTDSLATDDYLAQCVPSDGLGVEMKQWGVISLPYADTWPKNEPGQPVDCAPNSDFGAAVTAVHSLYLEGFSPELIPVIAEDTPGRQLRIDSHSGKIDPTTAANECKALGWNKLTEISNIYYIYHQCDGYEIDVTPVRMRYIEDRWLMVYEFDGRIRINEADPGSQYFPFEGGD